VARHRDVATAAIAIVLHAGLAVAIVRDQGKPRVRSRPIEVEFRRPKPVVPEPPKPALAEPEPERVPAKATPRPARPVKQKLAMVEPPVPSAVEPPPRPQPTSRPPTPPVYGIAMASPTAVSSPISAPVGGSTVADPGRPGRPNPGATGVGAPGDGNGTGFASALQVKAMPEIDTDACGKTITYPAEAERAGIEGSVRLRVALDQRGRVSSVRVLRGLGYGLDQAAMDALKHRCKFTPAIAEDGRPVPFVVESYTFNFELPR
jgi:periplasmic protein TonB